MNIFNKYFNWLQKDNPVGVVDRFPELTNKYETSVPGIYCVGDLTGIPLIKLAADSGYDLVEKNHSDSDFQKARREKDKGVHDYIIIGGGPSGISAAIKAKEFGYDFLVIESSQIFNTIVNFPKGKPIYVTPKEPKSLSSLKFKDGTKETLLQELFEVSNRSELPVKEKEMVQTIIEESKSFTVKTTKGEYRALKVIVAIGKTGNARMLNVPGEKSEKVFTRLIDPGYHDNQDVLIVGGGDSAIEAANALADTGNRVTLSYRKDKLSRPKAHNVEMFQKLTKEGKIVSHFESAVKEIKEKEVILKTKEGEKTLNNDAVYALIGTEIPIQFFKRSNIQMEGEKNAAWWTFLITMLSFFSMLYFGKSGLGFNLFEGGESILDKAMQFFTVPFRLKMSWGLKGYAWYSSLNFYFGWASTIVFLGVSPLALFQIQKNSKRYFGTLWGKIKYSYLTICVVIFLVVYFKNLLFKNTGWAYEPTYWYSLIYSTTILLFGIRRMIVKPTKYIIYQTSLLIFIQVFFLFLLPYHLYDFLIGSRFAADSFMIKEVFPEGMWSSFGLILFWPLNINNFGTSTFWTWFPFVQTFVILFYIVQKWGKGVYCGWICSCGAMAETLGDEYRAKAPHGAKAKKLENIGQVVLFFALISTAFHFIGTHYSKSVVFSDTIWGLYKLMIDIFFAGVLGLGVYFFLGGRIWCRYGCPLAALMHIYTRFSPYRIMSNKKRCISCNICTKVCHMGIDVMNYANKGVPMNDAECVRCSACIVNCPMQVLTFGSVGKIDPYNKEYKKRKFSIIPDWRNGLLKEDTEMLLKEEKKNY